MIIITLKHANTLLLSCFIWLNYGIITADGTLAFTNFVGTLLNCSYVLLYYWYAPNKVIKTRPKLLIFKTKYCLKLHNKIGLSWTDFFIQLLFKI